MSDFEFIIAMVILAFSVIFVICAVFLLLVCKFKKITLNQFLKSIFKKKDTTPIVFDDFQSATKFDNFEIKEKVAEESLYKIEATHNNAENTFSIKPFKPSCEHKLAYNYTDVKLAMTDRYYNSHISIGSECAFCHEPSNQYDKNAVAVYCNNLQVGYLYANNLQKMYHDFIAKNGVVTGFVSKIEDIGFSSDVYINLSFYQRVNPIKELKENHSTSLFKLTNTSSAEKQENIFLSSEGEEIYYNWDFEKEKYGCDIGFFPKSANKYLENNALAYIYKIDEDENGKYSVTAIVQTD